MVKMILSVAGSDRPGLTQALADMVYAAGGNWLESHLSRLGGKYVGSVLVELDDDGIAALHAALGNADLIGLQVALVAAGDAVEPGGGTLKIDLVGQDRPGIVREVTAVLARIGANIEDFDSRRENGSWSGERLFRASLRLGLPAGMASDAVRDALEAISGEIMVDFTID